MKGGRGGATREAAFEAFAQKWTTDLLPTLEARWIKIQQQQHDSLTQNLKQELVKALSCTTCSRCREAGDGTAKQYYDEHFFNPVCAMA